MQWHLITGGDVKAHFVHSDLEEALMLDLAQRCDGAAMHGEPAEYGWVDLPGMRLVDEALWTCSVTGLVIPALDVAIMCDKLTEAPERTFADGTPYHKLHGWRHCVVLTPEQRGLVLANMRADATVIDAQVRADTDRLLAKRP